MVYALHTHVLVCITYHRVRVRIPQRIHRTHLHGRVQIYIHKAKNINNTTPSSSPFVCRHRNWRCRYRQSSLPFELRSRSSSIRIIRCVGVLCCRVLPLPCDRRKKMEAEQTGAKGTVNLPIHSHILRTTFTRSHIVIIIIINIGVVIQSMCSLKYWFNQNKYSIYTLLRTYSRV